MKNLENKFPDAVKNSKNMAISFNSVKKFYTYIDREKVKNEIAKFADPKFDPRDSSIQMQRWQKEILMFVNQNLSRKDKDETLVNNTTDNDNTGEAVAEAGQKTNDAR